MDLSRQTIRSCHCKQPSVLSTFILLSAILPTASFAQPTNEIQGGPLTPNFQTTNLFPRQNPPSSGDINGNGDSSSSSSPGFGYYVVIIGIVGAIIILSFLCFKVRRRKQRAALRRAPGSDAAVFQHRTLGQGWPTNPVAYAHRQYYAQNRPAPRVRRAEGLDERGEAPPPYVPGTKPPSIDMDPGLERVGSSRTVERRASSVATDVELGDMSRPTYAPPSAPPPGYQENGNWNSNSDSNPRNPVAAISRPEPAITTDGGLGSMRRHRDSTDRSSHV